MLEVYNCFFAESRRAKQHQRDVILRAVLCILTSFWMLRAPESWLKYFFFSCFQPLFPYCIYCDVTAHSGFLAPI